MEVKPIDLRRVNYIVTRPIYPLANEEALTLLSKSMLISVIEDEYPVFLGSEAIPALARDSADYCRNRLYAPVIVTKTGLFVDALNGFPGPHTSFALLRLGNQGILTLLRGKKLVDRQAAWHFAISFAEPGLEPVTFSAITHGYISHRERGAEGFGFDNIFIPEGSRHTFAESHHGKTRMSARKVAIEKFVAWYIQTMGSPTSLTR
jgi:XTP/dITP diphosphohydrolase